MIPNYFPHYYYCHSLSESLFFFTLDLKCSFANANRAARRWVMPFSLRWDLSESSSSNGISAFQLCSWPVFWRWITLSHVIPLLMPLNNHSEILINLFQTILPLYQRIKGKTHMQFVSVQRVSTARRNRPTICRETRRNVLRAKERFKRLTSPHIPYCSITAGSNEEQTYGTLNKANTGQQIRSKYIRCKLFWKIYKDFQLG